MLTTNKNTVISHYNNQNILNLYQSEKSSEEIIWEQGETKMQKETAPGWGEHGETGRGRNIRTELGTSGIFSFFQ